MRIAIDFDDTIMDKATGAIIDGAVLAINEWYKAGNEITIFTNRPDYDYSTVKAILDAHSIEFHRIICGKPSYDVFIDDKAMRFTGWYKDYIT